MAYNGGPTAVDAGSPSPQAQAYADDVMIRVSQLLRAQAGTSSAKPDVKPVSTVVKPTQTKGIAGDASGSSSIANPDSSVLDSLKSSFSLRTPEGRENLAGMAGSMAATAATSALPAAGFVPWVVRLLAPTFGSAIGGGAAATGEKNGSVAGAASRQAAMDTAGRAIAWPIVGIFKRIVAGPVARKASTAIGVELEAAKAEGASVTRAIRRELSDSLLALRRVKRQTMQAVGEATDSFIQGAKRFGAGQVMDAEGAAAKALADVQAKTADDVSRLSAQYDALVARPPSSQAAQAAVAKTLGGRPGVLNLPEGPIKRSMDEAGQAVSEAAASGPDVTLTPMREALQKAGADRYPQAIFNPGGAATKQVGAGQTVAARKPGSPAGNYMSREDFQKMLADQQALGPAERLPFSGLLALLTKAPDDISFVDAHALKGLLDERVTWDRTAKSVNEGLTKMTRKVLRSTMSGHGPYDAATAVYQRLSDLHRSVIGKKLVKAASTHPGTVAKLLDGTPENAQLLKNILVEQSARGGDAALGQRAWDGVRATYAYDNLLDGGVEKLSARVQTFLTTNPEFAKIVYGDASGMQTLSRYVQLGDAFAVAKAESERLLTQTTAAGKAAVTTAKESADRSIVAATEIADKSKAARKEAQTRLIEDAQAQGRHVMDTAEDSTRLAVDQVKEKAARFGQSSLRSFVNEPEPAVTADIVVSALGNSFGSVGYTRALMRILGNKVRGRDLLEYAAHSPRLTQAWVKVLTGQVPPQTAAATVRAAYDLVNMKPVASHEQPKAASK